MKARRVWLAVLLASVLATMARSGHELPVYPSYYPHEIQVETLPPAEAAAALSAARIHAYVGNELGFGGAPPEQVRAVESLRSFVLVRVNPQSSLAADEAAACAAVTSVVRAIAAAGGDMVAHPYPVTPLHGDYLHHVDRAEAAKLSVLGGAARVPLAGLRVKADGFAATLVPADWRATSDEWNIEVAEVAAESLSGPSALAMNGWLGPPWIRTGWFQAVRLLADAAQRELADDLARLRAGEFATVAARINLERDVVAALTAGCRAMVVGYRLRREFINVEFSAGIENIGFDALDGLNSPNFIRTVKLKDFPWNGWLSLGIEGMPAAAWNPIAGFTDPFGRLLWFTLADPAAVPSPYDQSWMLNRISDIETAKR